MLRPLLLTGGPAAGKTVTALRLAQSTPRCAFIDVDDVRQLVQSDGAAPWDGDDGVAQQMLGARSAASLACNFTAAGFSVTMSDVVTPETLHVYRAEIPEVLVVRLVIDFGEALRRANSRTIYLTDSEFAMLHDQQQTPLSVDHEIDVTMLALDEQIATIRSTWATASH